MARIRYTQEQKEKALALIEKEGVSETSRQLGITVKTLYGWRNEQKGDTKEKKEKAKRYTREEKLKALSLAKQIGVSKASEQIGVSAKSLYAWRYELGGEINDTPCETVADAPAEASVAQEKSASPIKEALTGLVTAHYPLRPGVFIEVSVPRNITEQEARRLSDFVKTLYFDED